MKNSSGLNVHFIGIGGIGVSALARYFLAQGHEVSGSDMAESEIIEELRKSGAKISSGLPSAKVDLVIYSAAVPEDNPELAEARQQGIKTQKYAEALGEITRQKYTIAVSGMHGKSTTTAMLGLIMEKAGLDPTVIVGTKIREWNNSNFRFGRSRYLLIEADEYDRSFLNYWPKVIVLTNIEEDHLDTYRDLNDIKETFKEYIGHLPADGTLIFNEEDENTNKLISNFQFPISKQIQNSKFKIQNFDSKVKDEKLNLKVPGRYNILNANAALEAARVLGIKDEISIGALNEFSGTWRRMEFRGKVNGAKIYDDYGHHPTEIKATLQGARQLLEKGGRLWCIFQPHQYQRTYKLFDRFIGAFGEADQTVLLPIYSVAGREDEEIKKKVSSEKLALSLRAGHEPEDILYLDTFAKAEKYLKDNLKKGDMAIIMGAGDIYKLTSQLLSKN